MPISYRVRKLNTCCLSMFVVAGALSACTVQSPQSDDVSDVELRAVFGSYEYEKVIEPQKAYSLYVTKDGNYYDLGDGSLSAVRKNSAFADDPANTQAVAEALAAQTERILASIDRGPVTEHRVCEQGSCETLRVKQVVLFVHGGLRTVKAGIGRTRILQTAMLADGVTPIFINWRSGFFTTYWDHLWRVRKGTATSGRRWQLPFTLLSDVLRTVADIPTAWASEAQHSLESWRVRKPSRVEYFADHDSDDPYVASVYFTGNEDVSHLGRDVLWWVTGPAKIVSTPMVHTLGKPPWDIMRTRALSTANGKERFPQVVDGKILPVTPSVCTQAPESCEAKQTVSAFLQSLRIHMAKKPVNFDRYHVTLIGHSMGAIVLNDSLRNNPEFTADVIVHMASADSVLNTVSTLTPYLSSPLRANTHYYSLSLHPNNDDRETSAKGMAPSGSLLVWIDNMYTSPATTLERTAGRFDNFADYVHMIPPSLIDRVHFKIFGKSKADGCDINKRPLEICSPQRHGDFSEAKFWDPAFYWR